MRNAFLGSQLKGREKLSNSSQAQANCRQRRGRQRRHLVHGLVSPEPAWGIAHAWSWLSDFYLEKKKREGGEIESIHLVGFFLQMF